MVEFKFSQFGENFGTREMGVRIRRQLLPLLEGDERVVWEKNGDNDGTNSFADEWKKKLLLTMPRKKKKKRTTFRGLNPIAEKSVLVALQRRYRVIKSQGGEPDSVK